MQHVVYSDGMTALLEDGKLVRTYKPYRGRTNQTYAHQIVKHFKNSEFVARIILKIKLKENAVLELPEEPKMLVDLPTIPKPKRKYQKRHKEMIRMESHEIQTQPSLPGLPEIAPRRRQKRRRGKTPIRKWSRKSKV